MMSLDTVSDFVAYLTKKEQFITAGNLATAFGEEDLLVPKSRCLSERPIGVFPKSPAWLGPTVDVGDRRRNREEEQE